jgi:hypothetical protein
MERFSPEAREVWLEMERSVDTPPEQRQPDDKDRLTEIVERASRLLEPRDQKLLFAVIVEKQRALKAWIAEEKRDADALTWLAGEMQEEGLRRGMSKEERQKMTVADFMYGGSDPTLPKPVAKQGGWSLKDYLRSTGKR